MSDFWDLILDAALDALIDTAKMLPFLFAVCIRLTMLHICFMCIHRYFVAYNVQRQHKHL